MRTEKIKLLLPIHMQPQVYIDGQVGTTGLKIANLLKKRDDIETLLIEEAKRKDIVERKKLINQSDLTILCLPDEAAIEALQLLESDNKKTKILDASTAHRTNNDWVYGLPEISPKQEAQIKEASLVSNPGCHSTGYILIVNPLIKEGLLAKNVSLSYSSITGYSGGGNQMIAEYESSEKSDTLKGSQPYALSLNHKHLPEMVKYSNCEKTPIFQPIIGDFHSGMIGSLPLDLSALSKKVTAVDLQNCLDDYYTDSNFINVHPYQETPDIDNGFLDPQAQNNTNNVDLFVFGNDDQAILCARYDNLGKGASGAAVQNLELMLGL